MSIFESLARFKDSTEVLVLVNGPDAESSLMLQSFPQVKVLHLSEHQHPGSARNTLVAAAQGEFCVFLDDDLTVPHNYFEILKNTISEDPQATVVGGPNWTPPSSNFFQSLQGQWLSDPWLVGPVARRYHLQKSSVVGEESLILCNLTIRTEVAKRFPFKTDLLCAEENEWLSRLSQAGYRFFASVELGVFHERRGTFTTFLQQVRKYGFGRGQIFLSSQKRWYHWFPSLALIGATLGLLLIPIWVISLFLIYWGIWLFRSFLKSPKYSFFELVLTPLLFPWVHLTYALFVLRGMQDSITRKASPF